MTSSSDAKTGFVISGLDLLQMSMMEPSEA